jgi:hypothetical protein
VTIDPTRAAALARHFERDIVDPDVTSDEFAGLLGAAASA